MSVNTESMVDPWRSELLDALPGVIHAVTRRAPGLGLADGNIAYSAPRDKADAWAMRQHWCAAAGLDPEKLVTLGQIHGAAVQIAAASHAGCGARPGSGQFGFGDALATDQPGPVLMTLHADCQPLLFVDPGNHRRGPAVAVAHAGWRGTVADVAGQTIAVMAASFGTNPEDVHVAIGPAIGPCCYEVGEEVVGAWRALVDADAEIALARNGERVHLSLRDANALLLEQAGVRADRIEMSTICTRCAGEAWFSHRGQGVTTGRFGAMIAIRGQ